MQRSKVLVIDQDSSFRDSIRQLLIDAGYSVTTLESAFGATRALSREETATVVLDMELPAMPGEKLIAMWRTRELRERLTIVALTSNGKAWHDEGAASNGADATLKKVDAERLLVPTLSALLQARANKRGPLMP